MPCRRDRLQPLERTAGEFHGRLPRRQVHHAEVAPEHAHAKSGPECLRASLLGGEALGVGLDARDTALGLDPLGLGEDTQDEAVAVTRKHALDAPDVAEIGADADNHGAALSDRDPSRRAWF